MCIGTAVYSGSSSNSTVEVFKREHEVEVREVEVGDAANLAGLQPGDEELGAGTDPSATGSSPCSERCSRAESRAGVSYSLPPYIHSQGLRWHL